MNMSATMSAYNAAKAWARRSGLTDEGRVNRALGILKKKDALERAIVKYGATVDECLCPSNQHSDLICKHRVAVMMFKKHQRIMNDEFDLGLSESFEPTGDYEPEVDFEDEWFDHAPDWALIEA